METVKALLESPAVNVFLGTLPLLAAIVWGLLQNDRRLQPLDKRMDGLDKRLDRFDMRFDQIDSRLERMETRIDSVDVRLTRVETRLEGSRLVMGD